MNPHCVTVIELFAIRERQHRLLNFAGSQTRRRDFVHDFLHDTRRIARDCLFPLSQNLDHRGIEAEMTRRGARNQAYCISTDSDFDDIELPLTEALQRVTGEELLVFGVGSKVAYYKNHEFEEYILWNQR